MTEDTFAIIDNLQAGLVNARLLPHCSERTHLIRLHERAINNALFRLPADERAFLADDGPEYIA